MNKINCNANNCSHNSNGVCYANRINVGGLVVDLFLIKNIIQL